MTDKINLNTNEILKKEFKKSLKGYDRIQVDQFLDLIIEDYDTFHLKIKNLEAEIQSLKERNGQKEEQPKGTSINYDVLKRLSNLEKAVFGQKESRFDK